MHNKDFTGDGEEFEKLSRGANKVRKYVNRISPDTAIHEQNGYAKLLDHKYYILMTNVDNDNSDKTYTNMHEV